MNYMIGVSSPSVGVLVMSPMSGWLTLSAFLILSSGLLWFLSKPGVKPPHDDEERRQMEYPDAA